MIAEITKVNNGESLEDLTMRSTYVSAMYPSLDIPEVARVVAEEYLNSER